MAPKRPQAAAEKRAEIVAAARRLFIDAGYDATPMSRLAKEAGVAPNTIYWYFPDKDEVLIAVLEAVMADVWPQYEEIASQPIAARLLWIVGKLTEMSRLVTTVHARVEHSAAVAEWHQNFHTITGSLLQFELQAAGGPRTRRRSHDRRLHGRRTSHARPRRSPAASHHRRLGFALDYEPAEAV